VPHLLNGGFFKNDRSVQKDGAILACCRTWWLASSCDWRWVVVSLEYITKLHVNSVDRWYGHKSETWYWER
jgi:hypothetical protein